MKWRYKLVEGVCGGGKGGGGLCVERVRWVSIDNSDCMTLTDQDFLAFSSYL